MTATAVVAATATIVSGAATAADDATPTSSALRPTSLLQGRDVVAARGAALPTGLPDQGRYSFLLELDTTSTSDAFDTARGAGATRSAASTAARTQLTRASAAQDAVIEELPPETPVLYETHSLMVGVAVDTDVSNYSDLLGLPGVAHVYPIAPKSFENSVAVPLQKAPQAWVGSGVLGEDITVAIIDTGLDYTHANFGGPGTTAAYKSAHARESVTADPALFPNDKVVGGIDLVGDSYNADGSSDAYQPIPHPDNNPLDCNGHGSHVGGTVAGYGENADGTTYTGGYDESTPFDAMKIGPGMAPRAELVGIRVFGCDGSSAVIAEAIDRATDPNGDGDPSDGVDVINMSLGSAFGSVNDADSRAADLAVQMGVSVIVSSGNSYDLYDVGGSPGAAVRALTVAASADSTSIVDGVNVDIDGTEGQYGAVRSMAYAWATKADLSGEVVVSPETNATACSPYSAEDAATIAGKVVMVTWTQEALECGSVARSANLAAAGATGFLFANSAESFSAGITGSASIPGVTLAKSGADAIRAAAAAGEPVSVTGTETNAVTQVFPEDTDKITGFSSRGTRGNGNVKPDVTAVGASVFSTASGTGNDGLSESGTSMAAPMVAGLAALVRSSHPEWSPEQVKADIMNTAGHDLYVGGSGDTSSARFAPNRVGAGRIDAEQALANEVLAYVTDEAGTGTGAVSVSFGPLEVTGPLTSTRSVKVENTGDVAATYATSYDEITSVPGVEYVVAPASVTVPAGGSATVTVTISIPDPTTLTGVVDETHGSTDSDGIPLDTIADASGLLLLTPTGDGRPQLRVPVYSAPRPASTMTQDDELAFASGQSAGTLTLDGTGVDNGTDDDRIQSLVAGFELQTVSGERPKCSGSNVTLCIGAEDDRSADIKAVGYTSDHPSSQDGQGSLAYLAINTHAPYSTPGTKVEFDVYIDVNGNDDPDLVLYSTRVADEDVFVATLVDADTGEALDSQPLNGVFGDVDTAKFDSDTLVLPLSLDVLAEYGVDEDNPRISYGIVSFASTSASVVDALGISLMTGYLTAPLSADLYEPGITVTDAEGAGPLVPDQDGAALTVTRNAASYKADKGAGLMMVHFHNKAGDKTQTVGLQSTPVVALEVGAASVPRNGTVRLSAAVTDPSGFSTPTGSVQFVDTRTGAVLATKTIADGVAAADLQLTSGGTHSFAARYAGDASYVAVTSGAQSVAVAPAGAAVSLSVLTPSVVRGGTASARVTVTDTLVGVVPTGAVTLVDQGTGTELARGDLVDGRVTLSWVPHLAGPVSLAARYEGDDSLSETLSTTGAMTVEKVSSTVQLRRPVKLRHSRAAKVRVQVTTIDGVPATGRVVLRAGKRTIGRATAKNGIAVVTWRPRKAGTYRLSAAYAGDTQYTAGRSKAVKVRVR